MMDYELDTKGARLLRKSADGFDRAVFVKYREGDGVVLNKRRVLSVIAECPGDAILASMPQGVYVQIGVLPEHEDYRRFLIRYDGTVEPIYSIDENAPPEAFDEPKGDG